MTYFSTIFQVYVTPSEEELTQPSPKSEMDLPNTSSTPVSSRNLSKDSKGKMSKFKTLAKSKPIPWKTYIQTVNSSSDFQSSPSSSKHGQKKVKKAKQEKATKDQEKKKKKELKKKISQNEKKGSGHIKKTKKQISVSKPDLTPKPSKLPKPNILESPTNTPTLPSDLSFLTSTPSTSSASQGNPIIDPEQLLIPSNPRPSRACKNLVQSYGESDDLLTLHGTNDQYTTISCDPHVGQGVPSSDMEAILSSSSPELVKLLNRPPLKLTQKTSFDSPAPTNSRSLEQSTSVGSRPSLGSEHKKEPERVSKNFFLIIFKNLEKFFHFFLAK